MTGTSTGRSPAAEASPEAPGLSEPSKGLTVVTEEPYCAETPLVELDSWVTPTARFFVRSHFPVPHLDVESWRLIVDGEVDHPLRLSFADLMRERTRTVVTTMECAGNSRSSVYPPAQGVRWHHGALGTARWTGVSLWDVISKAESARRRSRPSSRGPTTAERPGSPRNSPTR